MHVNPAYQANILGDKNIQLSISVLYHLVKAQSQYNTPYQIYFDFLDNSRSWNNTTNILKWLHILRAELKET